MFSPTRRLTLTLVLAASLALPLAAHAETTLRVFAGGQQQRPDLTRKMFDEYEKRNPGVKVQLESGGATSELQRQYLSTVLGAKDSTLDVLILDIINPAQYYAAGSVHPSISSLMPGDLVFWSSNGSVSGIHHVAIYIGNGNVLQAPQSGSVIQITPVLQVSWGLFGATRPLT